MANKWLEVGKVNESNRKCTAAVRTRRTDSSQQHGESVQTANSRTAKTDKITVSVLDTDLVRSAARIAYRLISQVYSKDAPLEPLDSAQEVRKRVGSQGRGSGAW